MRFSRTILEEEESEFPEHHFEFIGYNQLPPRIPYENKNSNMIYPVLTVPFRKSSAGQRYLRKINIEDLDGHVVEFIIWDEVAKSFRLKKLKSWHLQLSSCRVGRYRDIAFLYSFLQT